MISHILEMGLNHIFVDMTSILWVWTMGIKLGS